MNMEAPKPAIFSFVGHDTENPMDALHRVAVGLRAFALLFQGREMPLTDEKDLTGMCYILDGFITSLDSVTEHLTETIGRPRAEAARAMMLHGDAEYRRGQREAAGELLALLNSKPKPEQIAGKVTMLALQWQKDA